MIVGAKPKLEGLSMVESKSIGFILLIKREGKKKKKKTLID